VQLGLLALNFSLQPATIITVPIIQYILAAAYLTQDQLEYKLLIQNCLSYDSSVMTIFAGKVIFSIKHAAVFNKVAQQL
jgi:hypothetical protein